MIRTDRWHIFHVENGSAWQIGVLTTGPEKGLWIGSLSQLRLVPSVDASTRLMQLHAEFEALADMWHAETDHLSVTWQKELHPAYRYIIGMGRPAVGLILADLKRRGGWWFAALEAIARRDDVAAGKRWGDAVRAWEDWARHEGTA